jgi:small ligand-binding sensory domain FIST
MESLDNVQKVVQSNVNNLLQNPYLMAVLKVGLILYASRIAPRMPSYIQDTFANTFVKIIAIALLAYISEVDFQLAILLAIALVLGANILGGRGVFESYDNISLNTVGTYQSDLTKHTTLLGKPAEIGKFKLIESLSDNYPGCNKVTLKDLLELFDGDALKLQKTVQYTFSELNNALPAGKDKERLLKIARAAGLPYNVELSDATAPFIATLLLGYGYKVSETCQAPQ